MSITQREFQKAIDKHFNTRWQPDDFYVAYVNAHQDRYGCRDYYNLSRREQKRVRDIVNEIDEDALDGFKGAVIQEINERMYYFIQEVCE